MVIEMENILRKHILSNYAVAIGAGSQLREAVIGVAAKSPTVVTETVEDTDVDEFMLTAQGTKPVKLRHTNGFALEGPTYLTHAVEDSDPDEFSVTGKTTYETHTIETSDPDEFRAKGGSWETREVETSDPDEMYAGPTNQKFTTEVSDLDELLLM